MILFNNAGSISSENSSSSNRSYIVLSGSSSSSNSSLFAISPVIGVSIKQAPDTSISKAINGNFYVSTFGSSPVYITIRGFHADSCISGSNSSIYDIYDEYRVDKNPNKRLSLGIYTTDNKSKSTTHGAFVCIILGMETSIDEINSVNGSIQYTLSCVGVKI